MLVNVVKVGCLEIPVWGKVDVGKGVPLRWMSLDLGSVGNSCESSSDRL